MQATTDSQIKKNIATNVKRLRGEMSRYRLAHDIGVYPSSIADLESANKMPGINLIVKIAKRLGVRVDDLVTSPRKSRIGNRRRRAG